MIHFALLFSKQGKIRLSKYYEPYTQHDRAILQRDVMNLILPRQNRLCNAVEYKNYKLVYKRYASLYFLFAVDIEDNALITLEKIQHFVEILDTYFGNVCELDLIYSFNKAYYVLDEVFVAGELQESSKRLVARLVSEQDALVDAVKTQDTD
jgi:AP-1 complex subunit sigma 1/2